MMEVRAATAAKRTKGMAMTRPSSIERGTAPMALKVAT
jgi:hypothetical protein